MDGRKDNWWHRLLHGSNDGCRLPSQLLAAVSFTTQHRQEGRGGAVPVNRQAETWIFSTWQTPRPCWLPADYQIVVITATEWEKVSNYIGTRPTYAIHQHW